MATCEICTKHITSEKPIKSTKENHMDPMNTHTKKQKGRALHMRVLWTIAGLCMLQPFIGNVAFAQVKYSTFSYPGAAMGDSQGPTGVRGGAGGLNVYVTGIWHHETNGEQISSGLLYIGPLSGGGNSGNWTALNYPSSTGITVMNTSLYGPDGLPPGNVRLVGNYTTSSPTPPPLSHGLLYEGPPDGSGTWQTIDYPNPPREQVLNTIAHSTMGGLVVGNFDTNFDLGSGFVYNIGAASWTKLPKEPLGARVLTAYGIWYNGGTSYTIAGGWSDPSFPQLDQHSYLVNWDSSTQTASDWTSYDFEKPHTHVEISHFDGITTDNQGGFYLTGTWEGEAHVGGFFAHVPRMPHRVFGDAHWRDIEYPSSPGQHVDTTTGNTIFENNVLGIFTTLEEPGQLQGYLAKHRPPVGSSE